MKIPKELIKRVEKATGADRELDAAIVVALDVRPDWVSLDGIMWVDGSSPLGPYVLYSFNGKKSRGNPPAWYPSGFGIHDNAVLPAITASTDAALALTERLLPGQQWIICDRAMRTISDERHRMVSDIDLLRILPSALVLATLRALESQP